MKVMNKARCALIVLTCWQGHAAAQTPQEDGASAYTHAMPLTVSAKNAVVQLRLPKEVYLHSRSAELNDLRVFDAAGKALPYALVQPAAQAQASQRQVPVKVFPVGMKGGGQAGARSDVEIRTSPDGAVTSVTTRHSGTGQAAGIEGSAALVLDTGRKSGAEARPIDALVFTLPQGVDTYEGQVQLEVSDDLQRWETAGYASLSWLRNSNQETLRSDRMEFAARDFRYARLTWREGKPILFASIVAEAPVSTETAIALDSVTLKPRAGLFAGDLAYDAAIAIPVRRMDLLFAEQNIVLPAQVGNYMEVANPKGPKATRPEFVPRFYATFFTITQDGRKRSSGDIGFDEVHAQTWVVRPQAQTSAQPEMKLSWAPTSMVFLASGAAPYTLHFGRANAKPAQRDVAQVAPGFTPAELQALEQAVPGVMRQTSVAAATDGDNASRWRIYALWAVLVLGVAVLGWMARRLIGQMKEPE